MILPRRVVSLGSRLIFGWLRLNMCIISRRLRLDGVVFGWLGLNVSIISSRLG